jgi:hypothetical protein
MKRLLIAATLGWALAGLAKPPAGPPVSVTVTSEHLVEASPLRKMATGVTGQVEFTADGRQLVFVDPDGLKVLPLAGGKARTLASRAVSFRLTPDSRAVVVRGEPFTRLALEGKAAPVTLAPGQTAHTISGQALSSTWFSFVNEAGQLLRAGLDGSVAVPFELPPPKDHCCHAGAGDPKGFSANGEWLLYQYGASFEVVRADGSRRTPLDLSDAQLAGDLVVGTARDSQGASLVVIELATGKRTRITNTRLFAQARVVGDSVLQVDAQGRLIRADLKKASSAVVFDASPSGAVSPWLASDGKTAVMCVKRRGGNDVERVELATGQHQRLAQLAGSDSCVAEKVNEKTIVVYAWAMNEQSAEAVLLAIDLETNAVRPLGAKLKSIGNLVVAPGVAAVNAGPELFVATF